MPGEADEADLALLLRLIERFDHAVLREDQIGIVVVDYFVNLPDVQMIGLQTAERFVQHAHGDVLIAPMRADLGHQDHLVAFPLERVAEPHFTFAVVIIPGVVEEVDSGIDRFGNDAVGDVIAFRAAQMVSADADGGNAQTGFSQRTLRDLARSLPFQIVAHEHSRSCNADALDEAATAGFTGVRHRG